jgi:hypothetical protein
MADKEDSVGKKVLMAGLKGVAKGIDRPVAEANAFLNKKYKEYIPEGEKTEIFREKLFGKDPEKNLERAKNMAADTKNMKKGGKVSSASKRADGCAQRGKTKGRMV